MDCNRLPLARENDILYMYKHPNAIKHVQTIYDSNYTVNPRSIIKAVVPRDRVISEFKKEMKAKVSVSSFIIEDTSEERTQEKAISTENISEEVIKTEKINKDENTVKEESGAGAGSEAVTEPVATVDSWKFMVSNIDDTSSLYTENMWRDAIDSMKQKLIVFMTSGAGHKKYGPKKSRTILAWLTDNKRGTPASAETALVIADFIGWLVDVKVSSVETVKTNAPWIMFRKRGVWMIKNNV